MPSSRREREAREARERQKRYVARQQVHQHKIARRKRDNLVAAGALVVVATLATVAQLFYFADGPGAPTPTPTPSASAEPQGQNVGDIPSPELAEGRAWTGELVLNENVELGIELDGASAPQAVSVFLQEARAGYYDGTTCHRLVQSDTAGLLQCGSEDEQGAGDPEFAFGPVENAPADDLYPAGTIAMARAAGDGYTQGRQFFVVFADTQLPADTAGGYTVIGQVTSGLDALVSGIAEGGVDPAAGGEDGPPAVPTTITRVTIS
ncbi:MAG: peptidylprolyl isomerase [Actinomycetota bacterium]|nr:peptidylprolyl isomerase [Actinomycetota bacterium]